MSARGVIGAVFGVLIVLPASRPMRADEPRATGAPKTTASKLPAVPAHVSEAVARLVEQLQRHPVQPKAAAGRVGIYLMDVTNGQVTLIADQPTPGLTQCGSPVWSHDGRRILYDATPGEQYRLTRLESIALRDGRLTVTDVGAANCPTFSPKDDRIMFLSNAEGAPTGVWLMEADGSARRLLGSYGKPVWSPFGRQTLIIDFAHPRQVTVMDVDPDKVGVVQVPDHKIFPDPSWAGERTIVAAIGATEADTVALIDVSEPRRAEVKEILWRRANGPDVAPSYPIYSAITERCIFVGAEAKGSELYSVWRGNTLPAKQLGPERFDPEIASLAYSPDGRYVLYCIYGPDRASGVPPQPAQ